MPPVSRTLGPLHFEDLEPHRFEDLVRQLAHGFRRWQLLEPTGRLGADEGIDIRAVELIRNGEDEDAILDPGAGEDEEETLPDTVAQEWIIQCKREQTIVPSRIGVIVEAALRGRRVHGFILAAACDFSRKAREAFRRESAALGAREFYVWGKADLEDMLFRPENDHLLFAYFGVSLVVRRRSVRTRVRGVLAMKRKAIRAFGDVNSHHYTHVLLRDAEDTTYPALDENGRPGRWRIVVFRGYEPEGLRFEVSRFAAFLDDDREHWDAAFAMSTRIWGHEPWFGAEEQETRMQEWNRLLDAWRSLPDGNRAWLSIERCVRYDRIIDIDTHGDNVLQGMPHIYIDQSSPDTWTPWEWKSIHLEDDSWRTVPCEEGKRITKFAPEDREGTQDAANPWPATATESGNGPVTSGNE